ncbi:MAG TPA: hypothetical protein VFH38_12445, partial [Jatrophihabitans sp.]|nr:hypothetical protein [Jatrophihabitans sp.]
TDSGPGRGTDTAWSNATRRPPTAVQNTLGLYDTTGNNSGNTFAYYDEGGSFTPSTGGSATPETHWDTCDSSFEPNMVMNGPVYSQDAYLVDRGKDTGKSGQSMPVFNDYAYTMWNGVINGVQQAPNPNGGYSRGYPNTNGQLYTTLSPQPVYTTNKLELPANADKSKPLATCTYTGPTRILIKQGTAYITSPGTPTSPPPSGPDYCYQSTGVFTNPGGTGVADAQVPIDKTLIYVQNPTTGTPKLATPTNPIFKLQAQGSLPASTSSNTLTGTWKDNSTYSSTSACPSPPDPTKRRNFDCETSTASPPADMAKLISNTVNSTMKSGATTGAAMKTKLTNAVSGLMPNALIPPPTFNKTTGAYYQVSVGDPTVSTSTPTSTYPALAPADPFYQEAKSAAVTTTTMTATIAINRITCTGVDSAGQCNQTKTSAIYSGSATGSWSAGTPPTTTDSWPWFGAQTGTHTYTDPNNDITQYYNGYGDAYVEGTLKGNMTIVAEHDIVATNNITYNNTNLTTTTDGLALVADHDVRIYRPMTCVDDGTAGATTSGYCPNDLTGVYNTTLSWPLPNNYPALMYTPDNAPSMTSNASGGHDGSLYATIFTLRGCFMIDNFYRGGIGNNAYIYGGLYQYHRGPTSLPYQGRPYQGSGTKMPGIVLNYTFDNMRAGQADNGGLRVPWIPNPVGRPNTSTRTWNVVSISTGT